MELISMFTQRGVLRRRITEKLVDWHVAAVQLSVSSYPDESCTIMKRPRSNTLRSSEIQSYRTDRTVGPVLRKTASTIGRSRVMELLIIPFPEGC